MNGFKDNGLNEGDFGAKTGSIVSAFDAFRMSLSPIVWFTLSLAGGPPWTAPDEALMCPLPAAANRSKQPRRNPST